jgi:hypothetical protein
MSESHPVDISERLFTPAEARAALRLLSVELATLKDLVEAAEREAAHGSDERLQLLRERMEDVLEAIRARGVAVKGLNPLLLDFPGRRNGADIYLCWREGESDITHWHPRTTGFSDRRPIAGEAQFAFEYAN